MTTFDDILVAVTALGTGYVVSAVYENFVNTGRGFASPPLIPPSTHTLPAPKAVPQTLDEPKPNKHLCSGKCKAGSCDSQSFCIDSGCGSVIRGGDECIVEKPKPKTKPKPNSPRTEKKEPVHPNRPKKTTPGSPGISLGPIQGPDVSQIPGGGGGDQTSIVTAPGLTNNTDQSQVPDDSASQEQPFPIQQAQGQEEFPLPEQQHGDEITTRKPQREVPSTMPPSPPPGRAPPPDVGAVTPIQGEPTPVGRSSPTHNKNFTNGCGHGNDPWISCRAGIGTGPNGSTTPESDNQKVPVSTLIKNSQHFHAIYHFQTQDTTDTGHSIGAEITGGYCGSNDGVPQVGITIGVDGKGQILRRTEDHYKKGRNVAGDYNELTPEGASMPGCVGSIPEFKPSSGKKDGLSRKDFYIIWCADKDGPTVSYRGFLRVGSKEYQIANLVNPKEGGGPGGGKHHDSRTTIIDFTEAGHNTYLRGRTNSIGSICPTGLLYIGRYQPASKAGFAYSGPEGYLIE